LLFVNHGCNGSWNVNSDAAWDLTEVDADPDNMVDRTFAKGKGGEIFNPVIARHIPHLIGGYDVATRDIKAGEEILDNFLTTVSSAETWAEVVKDLQKLCKGQESAAEL
jgi:hypothetical protein